MTSSIASKKMLLLQHSNCVVSVAFSPNGDRLLTGSCDNNATIWRAADGKKIHVLRGHSYWVCAVQWSPSGDAVITGSGDHTARIWRSSTSELLATLRGHTGIVFGVDWSASGEHVVTASDDGTAKIWRPMTSECVQTTEKHPPVAAVAFSPNGVFFTTGGGGYDGNIRIFRTARKPSGLTEAAEPVQTLDRHSRGVRAVAWSPTGDLIASGSWDGSVRIWEVSTGQTIRTLNGHSDCVNGVAWSPNGDFILSGGDDKAVRIWAAATGEELQILSHHTKVVGAVAWSPRGDCIATASPDKTASIIHMAPPMKKIIPDDESKLPAHPPKSPKPKPPSNQQVLTKMPPPPQELNMKDDKTASPPPQASLGSAKAKAKNADDESKPPPPDDCTFHSTVPPQRRCFKHVEILSFDDALSRLLLLREHPKGRPDLGNKIPDDDDISSMKEEVDDWFEIVCVRDGAQKLISTYGLTPDEVKAILCYSMETPYKVYLWLNAWLMTDRRDEPIKHHIGPFFALLYQGMEKLPRIHCKASRGVLVRGIQTLQDTFHGYKECCKKGSMLGFWGLASFSTNDDVLAKYAGGHKKDAIVYSCEELECISIQELSRFPNEEEVLPLPPCRFNVVGSQRIESKLVIVLEQMDHDEISYLLPFKTK